MTVLSQRDRQAKLRKLCEAEGYDDVTALLEGTITDSVSPGICVECDATCEIEPDAEEGWCEACGGNAVHGAMRLAGLV